MLNDPPEELKAEIRGIGPIRVRRYERWVASLLATSLEPQQVVALLVNKGFSGPLAEWVVYGIRESVEKMLAVEEEIADAEEPSLAEVIARVPFSVSILLLLQYFERLANLSSYVFAVPVLMVAGLAAIAYLGVSVADLWERWRTRNLYR